MDLTMIGVRFFHKKGEFCQRAKFSQYTVCCFYTPFLYYRNGQLFEGEAGDIVINTPDEIVYHGPRPDSNEGFANDWLHVGGEDVRELLEKYPLPLNTAFNAGDPAPFRKYFKEMLFEHNSDEIGSSDAIKSIMTQMIIAMHRAYENSNTRHNEQSKIVAVRNAIVQSPEKRWTLENMAAMSGYSVSRFSELYRGRYNISPVNDVIAHRISYAKALLLSGQTTVSYVADACGFSTINYFSKLFKASVGCSPSEYMRKHGR